MINLISDVRCPNCGETLVIINEMRLCYPKYKRKYKAYLTLPPLYYLCKSCGATYISVVLQRVEMIYE